MEDLLKSLIDIQQRLDAPKGQYNNYGKYNYRSLEDIEAAIKPLLKEHSCGIRFSDQVVEHCGRTFLQTTLYFFNTKGENISITAEAEHSATKTGMDAAQITGAASSYARKYAMNALFAIAATKSGLDVIMARTLIMPFGHKSDNVLLGFILIEDNSAIF